MTVANRLPEATATLFLDGHVDVTKKTADTQGARRNVQSLSAYFSGGGFGSPFRHSSARVIS